MVELSKWRKVSPVRAVMVTEANAEELAEEWRQVEIRHERLTGLPDGPTLPWIVVDTLEGEVKAPVEENPYFCVGENGDTWLVQRRIFRDTYRKIDDAG